MFCLPWALRAQESLPYSYGFENNDLDAAGWTVVTGGNISTATPHTGGYCFDFNYNISSDAYLMSPILTGGTNGVYVSFYFKARSSSYPDHFKVGYTTDPTITDPSEFTYGNLVTSSVSWQQYEETFPAGTVRIAIKYDADNYDDGYDLYIDDFTFEIPTSCAKPTNLSKSDVTAHTAVLSWTSDASAWQICLNNDETNLIDVAENPYTLPGLTAETAYTAKVRAVCGGDYSNWTNPISFTTGIACPAPTALTTVSDGFDATFTWTSGSSEWQVAYSTDPDADPTDNVVSTVTEASYSMNDLELGDHYLWVRSNCGGEGFSSWVGPKNVHIGYCVPAPTSVDGSGITNVTFGTSGSSLAVDDDLSMTSSPYYFDHSTQIGSSYPNGTVDMSIDYATNYSYYTWVWVDWNNDFSFSDDELVYSPTSTISSGTLNISFNVPSTVSLGDYRMRIQGADGSSKKNPCYTSTYSYLVDYTLRVLEAPSCTPAGNVAVAPEHITSNTAVVSWTNNNGSDATYTVKQGETVLTTTATTSYELTGLTAATTYPAGSFTVTSNCDEAMVVNVPAFTTACESITTFPWSENFESMTTSTVPMCWDNSATTGTDYSSHPEYYWGVYNYSDNNMIRMYNYYAHGPLAIINSPTIVLPAEAKELTFDYTHNATSGDFSVKISDDGGTTFTELQSFSKGTGSSNSNPGTFTEATISLADYTNKSIILQFYSAANFGSGAIFVDNIRIDNPTTCFKPSALMLETPSSATAYTATLKWTNGAEGQTAWQIAYSTDADFDPASVTPVDVTTNPATIEGLTQNTTYYAYVRANCGTDGYSAWCTNKATFTTEIACPASTVLTAGTPGPNSVELSWDENGTATAWQLYVSESDVAPADDIALTQVTSANSNESYLLEGLEPSHNYYVWVRANCGGIDGTSSWFGPVNFPTAASCPTPVLEAAGITNIAGHTADVAWTGFEQNDSYEVHYRTASSIAPLLTEDFEDATTFGSQWTVVNYSSSNASRIGRETSAAHNGTYGFRFSSYSNASTYEEHLINTNELTGLTDGGVIEFYYRKSNSSTETFKVGYSSTDNETTSFTFGDNQEATTSWQLFHETIPAGTKYISIQYTTTACNYYLHIDDIVIGTHVAAGAWQIENVAAPATSTTLTNLDPETLYDVYVTGHCATGDVTTDPSATQTFKTTVACIAPTGLEVTANGVDATFTWESEVGSYEIARATTSDANPNEFVVGTADEESYAMNDLDLGDYYLWVRANCDGEDNSTWSGPVSLHIGYCLPDPSSRDGKGITKVVFGTGENIVNNVDETNGLPSSAPYYGDYSAMVGAVPAGTEATIDITYNTCTSSCFNYGTLIWVDWDNSLTFEDDELVFVGQSSTATNPSGAHTLSATFTVPVDQALGNYRMRIAGADSYFDSYINGNATAYHSACFSHGYTVCHDYTLQVLEAPSCFAPTDLAVTYEGGTEATVSWTSEATAWNIDVNGTVTAITENPYTLTNLELATNYAVKVQAVCDAATSEWTNPANFTTDLCLPENQCELTFVLTDSYGDGWSGNKIVVTDVATGKVLGQLANANANGGSGCSSGCAETETYTLAVCNGREIQFSWVSGNDPYETSYTVYDLNGNEIFSGSGVMSAPVNYTVNCASCAPVTELEASVNGFDVTLTWEPGGSETDWAIRYREEGTADWNEDINDGSEYEIAGLLPGDYEAEVRALCGSSVTSGWTSTTFTVECPNYSGEETVSICADSYEWNGETYTTSGDKQKHFTLANGCDSLATLHLTLKSSSAFSDVTTVCANEFPTTFHGVQFSQAGTQTFTIPNSVNCDSVVTLTVNVKQPTSFSDVTTVCANELPTMFHGVQFTTAGTKTITLTNSVNCDSVVTLTVNVKQPTSFSDQTTVCANELPITFHGVQFTTAGTKTLTLTNSVNCDSVVTLTVNVKQPTSFSDATSVCANTLPITFHGVQFTEAGTKTFTLTNSVNCDSVVTLTVNVKQPTSFSDVTTVCANELPITFHGVQFTAAGTKTITLTNSVNCDSVVTLTVNVKQPSSFSDETTVCANQLPYTFHGVQFTAAGTKTITRTNSVNCDSVVTLTVNVKQPTSFSDATSVCANELPITFHGVQFTAAGTRTFTLTNSVNCDSVVTLTVNVKQPTTGVDKVEACNTFTWINGQTYNQSITGPTYTLTNAAGCDSVVTLNLTIYKSVTVELYDTVCEGNAYNNNGIYIRMLDIVEGDHDYTFDHQTSHQCDSTVVLHLHVDICDESCGQPIEDIDHNSYATMPVHRVCWMTSNLRTTRYADGTNIPFAIVYSYPYDPNNTDNLETFGRLYNWTSASKAVGTPLQGVCPDGWRLPTQAEFDELSLYFTESQLRSTDNWLQNPGTNESGFNKQPGGFYNGTTGKCERLGAAAHFYTADFQATGVTYQYSEYYCDGVLYDVTNNPQDGRSIRCVRDLISQ